MIVYFDTNVYIGAKYKFDSGKLATIKNLVNSGKVTVLYTNATTGEVIKHLEEDVESNVTNYNHAVRKHISALNEDSICEINELKVESIVTSVIDKLMNFQELDGVKEIPLNPLDADKLFEDYFAGNPPFEEQKPYEFKDAIMINAIKNYQKNIGEQICIVSSDEGFRNAFKDDNNFMLFEFLGKFLKYCNEIYEEKQITECIETEIKNGMLDDEIKEYLYGSNIWIDCYEQWEGDIEDIIQISTKLQYIEKNENQIYAIILNEVEILLDITYLDENTSYYDKEEHRYLFENYIHALEKHIIILETRVCCDIKIGPNQEYILQDFEVVEDKKRIYTIDLNDDTRISKKVIRSTFEDSDLVYCSQCGKMLNYDEDYPAYGEKRVCYDCMKSDDKGEVCPECGRKIPHEYMSSGFCQDCVNEKN